MAKKGYTYIGVIVDRSGSMCDIRDDMLGGFNEFLKTQAKQKGSKVSLFRFDTEFETVYENLSATNKAAKLTKENFVPRGGTALYDAIGKTIGIVDTYINSLTDDKKPDKVILVTITDGDENSSQEISSEQVKKLIGEKDKEWELVFMGANQDAIGVANSLGFDARKSYAFAATPEGTAKGFSHVGAAINRSVSGCASFSYSNAEYLSQDEDILIGGGTSNKIGFENAGVSFEEEEKKEGKEA